MAESPSAPSSLWSGLARLPLRLVRLPFDVLFLTWDFLRVVMWGLGNLLRRMAGVDPSPFAPCFWGGIVDETEDGPFWYFAPASKYGTKGFLRLLFARMAWRSLADGRRCFCWRGSTRTPPTSVWRVLLTGLLLAVLWGGAGAGVLWQVRRHFSFPRFGFRQPGRPETAVAPRRAQPDAALAGQFLAQGLGLEEAGRMDEARARYREGAACDPQSLDAHLGLGRTCLALGLRDEARRAFSRAVELDGSEPRGMLGLARVLRLEGAEKQALGVLRTLTERHPQHAEAQALLASCLTTTGDSEGAGAALEKALTFAPGDVQILAMAADVELGRGNLDRAEPHYRRLIDRDAATIPGRIGLARICRLRGKLAEAEGILRTVLRDAPDEIPAIEELVDVLVMSGRAREALALCRERSAQQPDEVRLQEKELAVLAALSMDNELCTAAEALLKRSPGNAMAHLQMGAMFLRHGLPVLAVDHCRKALTQRPGLERAYRLLVSAQLLSGELEPARESLERLLKVRPDDLEALFQLSEYHRRKNDAVKAAGVMRQAIAYHPGSAMAHTQLGQLLFTEGDLTGSLAAFREAHRLAPEDPKALHNLAAALNNAGTEREQALVYAEQAHKLEPNSPRILDTLGWILACLGRPAEGLPYAEMAVALQPEVPHLRYHHGAILAALGREEEARTSLKAALAAGAEFHGVGDARALLEGLSGGDGGGAGKP